MATIVTREFGTTAKGSPLTNQELDNNFTNLNTELGQKRSFKEPVKVATTAAITLSGTQTIDGIAVVVGDRVLVKNQASAATNGIYVVDASTWSRATGSDTALELGSAVVSVEQGTTNAFETFKTDFLTTSTLNTTAVNWHRVLLVENESVLLGTGSSSSAQLKFPIGTLTTAAAAGAVEYDGFHHTVVPNSGIGRAPITGPIFTSGIGTIGQAAGTPYALFPTPGDTLTLPVGTYFYETSFRVTVATTVTASTLALSLRGNGTAVGTQTYNGTSLIAVTSTAVFQTQVAATALTGSMVVTNTSSVAGRAYTVSGRGILKITTAGTIIPSYLFSGSLTDGTTALLADNYMMIQPLATSGTATQTGAWA